MKRSNTNNLRSTLTMALLAISLTGVGQNNYQIKNFSITIHGTSTIHDWEIKAEEATCTAEMILNDASDISINSLIVKIPVENFESGKSIMNNKTFDALKSDNFPHITFKLLSHENQSDGTIKANGNLAIAGKTKPIQLVVAPTKTDDGISFKGEIELLMSTFSVKPPTALLGTIKTDDLVKIKFEILLSQYKNS